MEGSGGESTETTPLCKSLLVPSVQELVSNQKALSTIPPRYIQSELFDPPLTSTEDDLQLPILDMEALIHGDPTELQRLHLACQEWGFFQVVKHGVSASLIERFKTMVEEFFDLPMEEKRKYWQREDDLEGFGQVFVMSEEQKLDWCDMFYVTTLPKSLQKPHLIPELPQSFRDTLEEYSLEVKKLFMQILDSMALSLGTTENKAFLRELFGESAMQSMRINYYPPCPQPEKVMGLTSHSDGSGLTILLQINQVEGLQIKKDGCWISVNPIPDAFVVNIGDALEILSNGVYRSVEHRAVVNRDKERLSVAAFHTPGLDREIGPSPSLITPENPARFRRISLPNYMTGYLSRKLEGKSYLDVMRIDQESASAN